MNIISFTSSSFDPAERLIKTEVYDAPSEKLLKAREYIMTGVSSPWLRKDMLKYSSLAKSGNEVFIVVPHTGYAYYHNVDEVLKD